jgi:adenylyl-sulfate kinase
VAAATTSKRPPRQGVTVWFTGLPSAGKTTIANLVGERLAERGRSVEVLDGDVVRTHLSRGLGFSKADRDENIRRIGYVAGLLARHGVVVLVSAISPYRAVRDEVRAAVERVGGFVEVHVAADLATCQARDVKGLYAGTPGASCAVSPGSTTPTSRRSPPSWCSTPAPSRPRHRRPRCWPYSSASRSPALARSGA